MEENTKASQKRKGVLTVEAAIILPVFILVMVFILNFMKLFFFHLLMQQALQNTGRTLAQYGYVIDRLKLWDDLSMSEEVKKTDQDIIKLSNEVTGVIDGAKSVIQPLQEFAASDGKNIETVISLIQQIINKVGKKEEAESFAGRMETLTTTLKDLKGDLTNKKVIVNYLLVSAMNEAGGYLVEWMVNDYLKAMNTSTSSLKNLKYEIYFEPAGSGVGSDDIILVATYDYPMPFFDVVDGLRLKQAVRVHAWVGGSTAGAQWPDE